MSMSAFDPAWEFPRKASQVSSLEHLQDGFADAVGSPGFDRFSCTLIALPNSSPAPPRLADVSPAGSLALLRSQSLPDDRRQALESVVADTVAYQDSIAEGQILSTISNAMAHLDGKDVQ